MNSQTPDLMTLLQGAGSEGILSAATMQNLNVLDLNAQLVTGMGISAGDVNASEVLIYTMEPDDSGSIEAAGNTDLMCEGHNLVLDAINGSKQRNDILWGTRYLNGFVLNPYCMVGDAVRMSRQNYRPNLGTPLYKETLVLLSGVMAKSLEFEDAGVKARTYTVILSDGDDLHSSGVTAAKVASLVHDMQRSENHIIAAIGIDDGQTNFKAVFGSMGIPDHLILTPKNNAHEIRQAFQLVSQSAVRASQGAASFSQALGGGFGNTP